MHSIRLAPEGDLTEQGQRALAAILEECFPDTFEGRTYYKQLPHSRLLLEGAALVGQVAVDLRVIRVGDEVLRILGIIDLCVRPSARGQGLATSLLDAAESLAKRWGADFLVLFADNQSLYSRSGFIAPELALIKWLAIDERTSHGQIERDLTGTLMVKPLAARPWPGGVVDLLGYLF